MALAATGSAQTAGDAIVAIDDPEINARYQAIIQEVRCLVCEGRSIAESPSGIAQDLKRLIRDMLLDGASDSEIASHLTARFGDSILYRPPVQPNTWALWGGPFILLSIGLVAFVCTIRARIRETIPIDLDEDSQYD